MKPRSHALDIAAAGSTRADSKEHKRFRDLLAKIERERLRLQRWQEQAPLFSEQYALRVQPLDEKLAAARREWVFELDKLLAATPWSRIDRQTLTQLLTETAEGLLGGSDDDAELLALHDRHAEVPHAEIEQQHVAEMQQLFQQMSGLDLGQGGAKTMDELLQRARQTMAAEGERQHDEPTAHRAHAHGPSNAPRKKPRTAAQKRAEADAEAATKNVREVYRKLAAALHPDRAEPGATDAQRAQRHEQMARANAAYEAKDLLALLTLQLEIEQVDVAHAATVAAEQVRHFNRVLAEQLRELQAETQEREFALVSAYGLLPNRRLDPDKLEPVLRAEVQEVLAATHDFERQRRALRGPPAAVKAHLKTLRAQWKREDELDDLLGGFFPNLR
jgi:hypothetical protein